MVRERQAELAVKEEDLRETRAELERTVLNLNRSRMAAEDNAQLMVLWKDAFEDLVERRRLRKERERAHQVRPRRTELTKTTKTTRLW